MTPADLELSRCLAAATEALLEDNHRTRHPFQLASAPAASRSAHFYMSAPQFSRLPTTTVTAPLSQTTTTQPPPPHVFGDVDDFDAALFAAKCPMLFSPREPGLGVARYAERLVQYMRCEPPVFACALALLRQAAANVAHYHHQQQQKKQSQPNAGGDCCDWFGPAAAGTTIVPFALVTKWSVHRCLFTACLLAAKLFTDVPEHMRYYADVCGAPVAEVVAMEAALIAAIGYGNMFVPHDAYASAAEALGIAAEHPWRHAAAAAPASAALVAKDVPELPSLPSVASCENCAAAAAAAASAECGSKTTVATSAARICCRETSGYTDDDDDDDHEGGDGGRAPSVCGRTADLPPASSSSRCLFADHGDDDAAVVSSPSSDDVSSVAAVFHEVAVQIAADTAARTEDESALVLDGDGEDESPNRVRHTNADESGSNTLVALGRIAVAAAAVAIFVGGRR